MSTQTTPEEKQMVLEQLAIYGLMKFPKEFMNIAEKTFSWVYENRPEWVGFSEKWKESTGLFKFWFLYVKLRGSVVKNNNDQPSDGAENGHGGEPVYTLPVDNK